MSIWCRFIYSLFMELFSYPTVLEYNCSTVKSDIKVSSTSECKDLPVRTRGWSACRFSPQRPFTHSAALCPEMYLGLMDHWQNSHSQSVTNCDWYRSIWGFCYGIKGQTLCILSDLGSISWLPRCRHISQVEVRAYGPGLGKRCRVIQFNSILFV